MSKEAEYESKERIFFENWMTENEYEYDNIPIEELLQAYADEKVTKILRKIIDYRVGEYEDFSDGYVELKYIAKEELKQLEK